MIEGRVSSRSSPFLNAAIASRKPKYNAERGRKTMNRVIKILMKRDGLTEEEAREMVEECMEELYEGNEYALEDVLGLEPDYIDYLF